ncbi:MAG: phage tail protein [Nitrospira sp.]|nr:phage tail protein [Nitrospira sp.]
MPVKNSNKEEEKQESRYLDYLPGFYRDDKFMGQYLNIFEDILDPIESTVNNVSLYFDPMITLKSFIPWLETWLDLNSDPTWTIKKRRELVKSAATLYRMRGTKRGLSEYLRIYTGNTPEITEYIKGMSLDKETKLGIDTKLGSAGTGNHFTVSIKIKKSEVEIDTIRSIIESQKPAHTVYTLQIVEI